MSVGVGGGRWGLKPGNPNAIGQSTLRASPHCCSPSGSPADLPHCATPGPASSCWLVARSLCAPRRAPLPSNRRQQRPGAMQCPGRSAGGRWVLLPPAGTGAGIGRCGASAGALGSQAIDCPPALFESAVLVTRIAVALVPCRRTTCAPALQPQAATARHPPMPAAAAATKPRPPRRPRSRALRGRMQQMLALALLQTRHLPRASSPTTMTWQPTRRQAPAGVPCLGVTAASSPSSACLDGWLPGWLRTRAGCTLPAPSTPHPQMPRPARPSPTSGLRRNSCLRCWLP